MKYFLLATCLIWINVSLGQSRENPIIKSEGGIYKIPEAVEKPSNELSYDIVIDLASGASNPEKVSPALNNIARMLNLHAVGGVVEKDMNVVGVAHATNTKSILSNAAYRKKYGVDNPNITLIKELTDHGVKLFVCGQSLIARGFETSELHENVELSVSALTILTTYQLQGFAALKF